MSEAERLADEMAEAAIYYFKIQEAAPPKPDRVYWKVRIKAKDLLRAAVFEWKKYLKKSGCGR